MNQSPSQQLPPQPPRPLTASLVTGLAAAVAFAMAALGSWEASQTLAFFYAGLAALSLSVGLKD